MEIGNEIMKDVAYLVDSSGNLIHSLDSQFKSLNLEEAAAGGFIIPGLALI